jgi:hypothetical protein
MWDPGYPGEITRDALADLFALSDPELVKFLRGVKFPLKLVKFL